MNGQNRGQKADLPPLVKAMVHGADVIPPEQTLERISKAKGGTMTRVLTVDDSKSMRQMIKFTLETAGMDVVEMPDGKEAYEWAQKNVSPDVILADINMPIMDGLTLIKHLRQLPEYAKTPILMLTTDASSGKKMEGKETGATGWIVKPFHPEHLIETIQKVIRNKK